MGCSSCLWCFVKVAAVCLAITFIPGIPPHAEYKAYTVVRPRALNSDLAKHIYLNNAQHLFEGEITGPEAFAEYNGEIYTGVHGGFVVRVDKNELTPIVKFGKNCEDMSEEKICGRPLGMKFDKSGNLYVADSYYGVFKYNLKRAESTLLVDVNQEIEGKKSAFINDVAVASDGSVYVTVSSTSFYLEDGVHALLAPGDGRILKYDPKTHKTSVMLENLYFPNGIVMSQNEDFLIFTESVAARVMKLYLTGSKRGQVEVFAEGLPGLPDNIRSDGRDGFYVSIVAPADDAHPALPFVIAPFPNLRRFFARVLYLIELPLVQINNLYPNYFCRRAVHAIGHFGPTSVIMPKETIILQLDGQGNIKDALIGTDGSVSHVSDMVVVGNDILLGSPYNNFIGRVPRPEAPSQINIKSVRFEEEKPKSKDSEVAAKKEQELKIKKAAEEAKAKKAAEEAGRRAAEEAKAKQAAEDAAKKAAEEAKAKEAAKRAAEVAKAKKVAEEAAKKVADEAKAKKAAEEAVKKAAEEAKAKKAAEEAAKKAAEEARIKKAAEDSRKAAEEAKAKKVAEEAARKAADKVKADNLQKKATEQAKAKKPDSGNVSQGSGKNK